jgi:putative ABC transport system ATP-binding protein
MSLLSLQGVCKGYRRGHREIPVFKEASLSVEAGDYIGIFGSADSGKSTLMLLCAGLLLPDAGVVRYRGRDMQDLTKREQATLWRTSIGVVSHKVVNQSPPERRVVDYVATPLLGGAWEPDASIAAARDKLDQVGAQSCHDARLDELSPGERTRVELARALIRDPELLLIDEPESSSSLKENETIRRLLSVLGREAARTVIIASANPGAMPGAHRYVAISDGRLLAEDETSGTVIPLDSTARTGRGQTA